MTQRTTPPLPFAAHVPPRTKPALPLSVVTASTALHPVSLPAAPSAPTKRASVSQPTLFAEPPQLQEATVLVASIRPNPNLRNRDILESVGVIGVTQPILITPIDDPHYLYGVVAGGRRLHSAIHFKLDEIKVNVTGGTPAQLAMLRAVENGARSSNPVAEARAYQEAMNAGVYASERDLAKDMGLDAQLVRKRLKLAGLPEDILEAVDEGRLSCPNAERIVKLGGEYRDWAFRDVRAALLDGRKFTGDDLKNVKTRQKGDMSKVLSGLLGALPASAMQPLLTLSPVQLLAEEFRAIAQERGVDLAEVVALLGSGVSLPVTVPVLPVATGSQVKASPVAVPVAPTPSPARPAPPFAPVQGVQTRSEVTAPLPAPFVAAPVTVAVVTAPVVVAPVAAPVAAAPVRAPLPFPQRVAQEALPQPVEEVQASVIPELEVPTPEVFTAEISEPELQDAPLLDDGYGVQTSALLTVGASAAPLDGLGLLGTDRPDQDGETISEMPWPGFEDAPSVPAVRGPSLDDLSDDVVAELPVQDPPVDPPHAPLHAQQPDAVVQEAVTVQEPVSVEEAVPVQEAIPAAAPSSNLLGLDLSGPDQAEDVPEQDLPWPMDGGPDAVQAAEQQRQGELEAAASEDFTPEFLPFIEKSDDEPDDDGTVLRRAPTRVNLHAAALGLARPSSTGAPRRANLIPRR